MILNATSEYRVVFLYLFWITTIFQRNILFKTNKCHHGWPPWSGGPGAITPVAPPLIRPWQQQHSELSCWLHVCGNFLVLNPNFQKAGEWTFFHLGTPCPSVAITVTCFLKARFQTYVAFSYLQHTNAMLMQSTL